MQDSFNIHNFAKECIDFITSRIPMVSVKILSEKFNMHPNLFCYYFRKVTGKNFKRFIQEKRLELAKFMLLNAEKSISEIGRTLGYSEVSNFTHFFKRSTGMNPFKYKKNIQKVKIYELTVKLL